MSHLATLTKELNARGVACREETVGRHLAKKVTGLRMLLNDLVATEYSKTSIDQSIDRDSANYRAYGLPRTVSKVQVEPMDQGVAIQLLTDAEQEARVKYL